MIYFKNKIIAVLGLGIEGSDIVWFLQKQEAKEITVFDQKSTNELNESINEFKSLKSLRFKIGQDYLKDGLKGFDIIFRSPAFKLTNPAIVEARKAGVVISSATRLFFELCPGKIIGVTGTKGKGTTATLIYRILKKAGKKVFLAGNIGEPMLAILPQLDKNSWVVLELSSFQLQDLDRSPHISVVLFITSEHLDYHASTGEYIKAKTNIVSNQQQSDFAVLNADNATSRSFAEFTKAEVIYFSRSGEVNGAYVKNELIFYQDKPIGKTADLKLLGIHNLENICASITASFLAGADIGSIKQAVYSFSGLEHCLQLVSENSGVKFYNDSFSTTPETTIAAINSFTQPIILICGGSDKGSDYNQLGNVIAHSRVKTLILIGQMANQIKEAVMKAGYKKAIVEGVNNMPMIVKAAVESAQSGDIVLLSPACASFGMFKNYKDRGEQFIKYVQAK